MKIKTLCDNCGREFSEDDDVVESLREVICPQCIEDLTIELPN